MTAELWCAIALASGFGAVFRYWIAKRFERLDSAFQKHYFLFVVNAIGSFVAGFAIGLSQSGSISDQLLVLCTFGFAGGISTFSTFTLALVELSKAKNFRALALLLPLHFIVAGAAFVLAILCANLITSYT